MSQLMPYVDVCIANEEDAADVFWRFCRRYDNKYRQKSAKMGILM